MWDDFTYWLKWNTHIVIYCFLGLLISTFSVRS